MANVSVNFHMEKCEKDIRCFTHSYYINLSLGYHPKELNVYFDLKGTVVVVKKLGEAIEELKKKLKEAGK